MNHCIFSGNLGDDAKVSYTAQGNPFTKFDLAVSVGRKAQPRTAWFKCTAFGAQAESLASKLTIGQRVVVSGRLSIDYFTKRDGSEATDLELNVAAIEIASRLIEPQATVPGPHMTK
jgi:single-strand DNA-binding protein